MNKQISSPFFIVALAVTASLFSGQIIQAAAIVADHSSVAQFSLIPQLVIQQIGSDDRLFYGHTSHGSQIVTGMGMIHTESTLYVSPPITEYSDDLGTGGDTTWAPIIRQRLNQPGNNLTIVVFPDQLCHTRAVVLPASQVIQKSLKISSFSG